jgi:hypothetical protein
MHCPSLMNCGKLRQPPFLHWSFVVGSARASVTVTSPATTSRGGDERGQGTGSRIVNRLDGDGVGRVRAGRAVVLDQEENPGGAELVGDDHRGLVPGNTQTSHRAAKNPCAGNLRASDKELHEAARSLSGRPAARLDLELPRESEFVRTRGCGADSDDAIGGWRLPLGWSRQAGHRHCQASEGERDPSHRALLSDGRKCPMRGVPPRPCRVNTCALRFSKQADRDGRQLRQKRRPRSRRTQ